MGEVNGFLYFKMHFFVNIILFFFYFIVFFHSLLTLFLLSKIYATGEVFCAIFDEGVDYFFCFSLAPHHIVCYDLTFTFILLFFVVIIFNLLFFVFNFSCLCLIVKDYSFLFYAVFLNILSLSFIYEPQNFIVFKFLIFFFILYLLFIFFFVGVSVNDFFYFLSVFFYVFSFLYMLDRALDWFGYVLCDASVMENSFAYHFSSEVIFHLLDTLVLFYPEFPHNILVDGINDTIRALLVHLNAESWSTSDLIYEFKKELLYCLQHQRVDLANRKIDHFINVTYPRLIKPL